MLNRRVGNHHYAFRSVASKDLERAPLVFSVKLELDCLTGLQLPNGSYPRVWGATMFGWVSSIFQKGRVGPPNIYFSSQRKSL